MIDCAAKRIAFTLQSRVYIQENAKRNVREECNFISTTGVLKNKDNVTIASGLLEAGDYIFVGGAEIVVNTTLPGSSS